MAVTHMYMKSTRGCGERTRISGSGCARTREERGTGMGEGRRGEQQRGERDATVHASKHDDDSDNGTDDRDQQY